MLSTTLTEAPGENSRIRNAPATEVIAQLRKTGEGDILVNRSPTVIKELLAGDAIDRLELLVVPEIAGGDARLLEEGVTSTTWALTPARGR